MMTNRNSHLLTAMAAFLVLFSLGCGGSDAAVLPDGALPPDAAVSPDGAVLPDDAAVIPDATVSPDDAAVTDTDAGTDAGANGGLPTDCTGLDDFTPCFVVTAPDRDYDICVNEVCVSPGCGDATCNTPGPHFPLADTNQRLCYDDHAEMTCPSEGADFYGQDAQYGWDVTNDSTVRFARDTTTVSTNPVVTDNVTGLMWQGCAAGLTDASCATGTVATYTWADALLYCDGLSYGGYIDWRLPDEYELDSIVDAGKDAPSIDTPAFPATPSNHFWTSASLSGSPSIAWYVSFSAGDVQSFDKSSTYYVRCVRGGPTPQPRRFTRDTSVSGYPVVADSTTGLEWQGCTAGWMGDDCTSDDTTVTGDTFTWQNALSHCGNLSWAGHSDWRLPNRKELRSIVDNHLASPSIDTTAFPATPSYGFWSSSSFAWLQIGAWLVYFSDGSVANPPKVGPTNYARCVRGGH